MWDRAIEPRSWNYSSQVNHKSLKDHLTPWKIFPSLRKKLAVVNFTSPEICVRCLGVARWAHTGLPPPSMAHVNPHQNLPISDFMSLNSSHCFLLFWNNKAGWWRIWRPQSKLKNTNQKHWYSSGFVFGKLPHPVKAFRETSLFWCFLVYPFPSLNTSRMFHSHFFSVRTFSHASGSRVKSSVIWCFSRWA